MLKELGITREELRLRAKAIIERERQKLMADAETPGNWRPLSRWPTPEEWKVIKKSDPVAQKQQAEPITETQQAEPITKAQEAEVGMSPFFSPIRVT